VPPTSMEFLPLSAGGSSIFTETMLRVASRGEMRNTLYHHRSEHTNYWSSSFTFIANDTRSLDVHTASLIVQIKNLLVWIHSASKSNEESWKR